MLMCYDVLILLMAMSILEYAKKINPAHWPETAATSLIIILVALGGFGLGRLSRIEEAKVPLRITESASLSASISSNNSKAVSANNAGNIQTKSGTANISHEGFIVASKTGKKYHFPWCASAQTIKEENKVWFATVEEAQQAGYTAAGNCKGLPQ